MYHPNIIRAYQFRVIECDMHAIDACAEVAEFGSLNIRDLALFLRTIDAIGAHHLRTL
jgi:hypothetical protein